MSKSLVAIFIGINDISDSSKYTFPRNNATSFPPFYTKIIDTEFKSIETIYKAGYRNYLYMNLPHLEHTVRALLVLSMCCMLIFTSLETSPAQSRYRIVPWSINTTQSSEPQLLPSKLHIIARKWWFSIRTLSCLGSWIIQRSTASGTWLDTVRDMMHQTLLRTMQRTGVCLFRNTSGTTQVISLGRCMSILHKLLERSWMLRAAGISHVGVITPLFSGGCSSFFNSTWMNLWSVSSVLSKLSFSVNRLNTNKIPPPLTMDSRRDFSVK